MLRDHCALESEMIQRRGSDASGEIETDADLSSGTDWKGHGVTEHRRTCRDVTELWPPKVTV